MERITIRYQILLKTLKTLEIPLKQINNATDQDLYRMIRDSLIQRFEYSYEALWQFFKQLLSDKFGIEALGTNNIFRQALKNKLITEKELEILLRMTRDRNQTSHTYKEQIAQAITEDIPQYFQTMTIIAQRLNLHH